MFTVTTTITSIHSIVSTFIAYTTIVATPTITSTTLPTTSNSRMAPTTVLVYKQIFYSAARANVSLGYGNCNTNPKPDTYW